MRHWRKAFSDGTFRYECPECSGDVYLSDEGWLRCPEHGKVVARRRVLDVKLLPAEQLQLAV